MAPKGGGTAPSAPAAAERLAAPREVRPTMTMVTERQRRWLTAVLVLGTFVLAIVLISLVGSIFFAFGDIVLVFFLAWLLAFILSPIVAGLTRHVPFLPRIGAVVLVYAAARRGDRSRRRPRRRRPRPVDRRLRRQRPDAARRPADAPRPVAGPAQRPRPRPGRPRRPGDELPRQPRELRRRSSPARSSSWPSPASGRWATSSSS